VSGSEKLDWLDHDGNQQRSIANVQNDGLNTCMQPGFAIVSSGALNSTRSDQRFCQSHSVEQMT